jgi:3-methyladenine DNA glycosylase AlkD
MISVETALLALKSGGDPDTSAEMLAYHKAQRRYLGLDLPSVEALAAEWRAAASVEGRVALAAGLWDSDIHEARVAAAKLLTQARLRPDAAAWALICAWVPGFDALAIADHASVAGAKRLVADPSRLDVVEGWTTHPNMWARRAAFVVTLPWAKMANPKAADLAVQARVLDWAGRAVADRDWFMQKAVAGWVRDLSKHDPEQARAFVNGPGQGLKAFALKEASRFL